MKIVKVTWNDAAFDDVQRDIVDVRPGVETCTVGYQIVSNKQFVVIAMDLAEEDQVRYILSIPKSLVLSVEELTPSD